MGLRTYYLTNDPHFAEFMYFTMKFSTPAQRSGLTPFELIDFRTDGAMRKFAENQTLEARLVLLTRMGIEFTVCLKTDRLDYDQMFKDHSQAYPFARKSEDMVKALKRGDMFVFGSREMMVYQHLAAQYCHGQVYVLDYDYFRVKNAFAGERGVRRPDKMKEAVDTYEDLARLVFNAIDAFRHVEATSSADVSEYGLRVLMVMFGYRHQYLSIEGIAGKMGESYRGVGVRKSVTTMLKTGMVMKMKVGRLDGTADAYTITSKGIDAVMNFLKHVKNRTFNEHL